MVIAFLQCCHCLYVADIARLKTDTFLQFYKTPTSVYPLPDRLRTARALLKLLTITKGRLLVVTRLSTKRRH